MDRNSRIYVAGGETLIGAAILRQLQRQGYADIVGKPGEAPDLSDAGAVENFFSSQLPDYVFLAAGKSGGIEFNRRHPAELMRDNLLVESHLIHSAYRYGARKLLYLASSCCYPKHCPQPMRVQSLMTGPLEPTNEAYAVAKIAGMKLCQAYRSQYGASFIVGIPANAFGPGDDYSPEESHVVSALIRKMHEARMLGAASVEIWGTGTPRREFVFADDLADACIFAMTYYDDLEPINLGSGQDLAIAELALRIKEVTGCAAELHYDIARPDGMPLKSLDSSRLLAMGWAPKTSFHDALQITYHAFLRALEEQRDAGLRSIL